MSAVFGVLVVGIPAACLAGAFVYLVACIAATVWPRR